MAADTIKISGVQADQSLCLAHSKSEAGWQYPSILYLYHQGVTSKVTQHVERGGGCILFSTDFPLIVRLVIRPHSKFKASWDI